MDEQDTVLEYFEKKQGEAYLQGACDMLASMETGLGMISTTAAPGSEVEEFIMALSNQTRQMRNDLIKTFAEQGIVIGNG